MDALKRDAKAVLSTLKTADSQVICTKNCKIQLPVRFQQIRLAQLGTEIYILGVYALILETGEYAVSNMLGLVKINPDKIVTVKIADEEYFEFYFEAGTTIFPNTSIVKRDELLYNIFNEFIFNAGIPWYLEYNDLGKLFDTAKKFTGSNAANIYEVLEFLASFVSRNPKDRSLFYRLTLPNKDQPQYVALTSVFYSVSNTVNKIAGNYFSDGIVSALVNPSENVEKIEQLLRT